MIKYVAFFVLLGSVHQVHIAGSFAVHGVPGILPQSLHSLELLHNIITAIEGLQELT